MSDTRAQTSVFHAKDHLLRMIEHLRRETSYDYPPQRVFELLSQVGTAAEGYREAWRARDAFQSNHRRSDDDTRALREENG